MPNRRYHIHVIRADNDQLLVLDNLAMFFQARAFLTYDVSSQLAKASLYGRQCIDACDYALMIIGDSYGTVQKTGVSQMHLSYLNAKAKLKPLLILIKNQHQDAKISRQLQDFTNTVTKKADNVYYYDDEEDIEQLLIQAYYKMVAKHKVADAWVRVSEEAIKPDKPSINERPTSTVPPKVAKTAPAIISENMIGTVSRPIVLTQSFEVHYKAHAYAGGNLSEVSRTTTTTWHEVLIALTKMSATFSSYGLQNAINRLIGTKAELDIKNDMPNVHAVSRCQVAQADLNKLQRQLVAANWLQLTTYNDRSSQETWKLTSYAKSLLTETLPVAAKGGA